MATLVADALPAAPALDPRDDPLPPPVALADDTALPEPAVSALLLAPALPPAPPG
jgi:hypothetical protein